MLFMDLDHTDRAHRAHVTLQFQPCDSRLGLFMVQFMTPTVRLLVVTAQCCGIRRYTSRTSAATF